MAPNYRTSFDYLFEDTPPPLHLEWKAYEERHSLSLHGDKAYLNPKDRQEAYSVECAKRNADISANCPNISIGFVTSNTFATASDDYQIPLRSYIPDSALPGKQIVVYIHGGGLEVGDLDSEDLSCRRLCIALSIKVVSIAHRLCPDVTPQRALDDVWEAFLHIERVYREGLQILDQEDSGAIYLVGSSSGGQLAAQVSRMLVERTSTGGPSNLVQGMMLCCPITTDVRNRMTMPVKFRVQHKSYNKAYATSLMKWPPTFDNRTDTPLPLEHESFAGLPRTCFQLCTNDLFYHDGLCLAKELSSAKIPVKLVQYVGFPHTFWLRAPEMMKSLAVWQNMIASMEWLFRPYSRRSADESPVRGRYWMADDLSREVMHIKTDWEVRACVAVCL